MAMIEDITYIYVLMCITGPDLLSCSDLTQLPGLGHTVAPAGEPVHQGSLAGELGQLTPAQGGPGLGRDVNISQI